MPPAPMALDICARSEKRRVTRCRSAPSCRGATSTESGTAGYIAFRTYSSVSSECCTTCTSSPVPSSSRSIAMTLPSPLSPPGPSEPQSTASTGLPASPSSANATETFVIRPGKRTMLRTVTCPRASAGTLRCSTSATRSADALLTVTGALLPAAHWSFATRVTSTETCCPLRSSSPCTCSPAGRDPKTPAPRSMRYSSVRPRRTTCPRTRSPTFVSKARTSSRAQSSLTTST
mmetsp:Transcript_14620/g.50239  ORF Transcript_14620/g.50239 Transcript_14620/m.50239 type:complete len:233 (+) Transcript_14620:364-1062(+)